MVAADLVLLLKNTYAGKGRISSLGTGSRLCMGMMSAKHINTFEGFPNMTPSLSPKLERFCFVSKRKPRGTPHTHMDVSFIEEIGFGTVSYRNQGLIDNVAEP